MSSEERICPVSKQKCDSMEAGHCEEHLLHMERREVDRRNIDELKQKHEKREKEWHDKYEATEKEWLSKHEDQEAKISSNSTRILGVFVTLGIQLLFVLGAYYYVTIVDHRNNRGEEILLAKINADANKARYERERLTTQIVQLLTADAGQQEWQKGVIQQLQELNSNFRKITVLKPVVDDDEQTY